MSGADVLRQVREALGDDGSKNAAGLNECIRYDYPYTYRVLKDALAALDGCVLLTREEADELAEAMDWARGGDYDYLDAAVAFLTSTKEATTVTIGPSPFVQWPNTETVSGATPTKEDA